MSDRAVYVRKQLEEHKSDVDAALSRVRNALLDAVVTLHSKILPRSSDEDQNDFDDAIIQGVLLEQL